MRQTPGGTTAAEGETRYSYDAANQLVKVELYTGGSYTLLSEAAYNGDGERVSLTTYALGTPQTVSYVNGEDGLLVADDGSAETIYLYGQTQIAEYGPSTGSGQAAWNYPLRDSNASVRQTVDEAGAVTSARTYKPFGGTLKESGPYTSLFGFVGSQVDRLSGLLYANGRYYDPATGRYLTPGGEFDPLRPGTHNPYAPIQGPWWLLLPLVGVVVAWKGRRGGPGRMLVLVCVVGVGITLISCGPRPPAPGPTPIPAPPTSPTPQTTTPEPIDQTPTELPPPTSSAQTPPLPPPTCPIEAHTDSHALINKDGAELIIEDGRTELSIKDIGTLIGEVGFNMVGNDPVWFARATSSIIVSKITIEIRAWGIGGCTREQPCNEAGWRIKDSAPPIGSGRLLEKLNTNEYMETLPSGAGAGAFIAQFGFWIDDRPINIYTAHGNPKWSSFICWKEGPGGVSCPN